MKYLLLMALLLCMHARVLAQTDTIAIKRTWLGATFWKGEKKIWNTYQLKKVLRDDAEATDLFKKARRQVIAGISVEYIGVILIGANIGFAHALNKPVNPFVIGAGAACIGVSIPFYIKAPRTYKKAVATYNHHKRSANP